MSWLCNPFRDASLSSQIPISIVLRDFYLLLLSLLGQLAELDQVPTRDRLRRRNSDFNSHTVTPTAARNSGDLLLNPDDAHLSRYLSSQRGV